MTTTTFNSANSSNNDHISTWWNGAKSTIKVITHMVTGRAKAVTDTAKTFTLRGYMPRARSRLSRIACRYDRWMNNLAIAATILATLLSIVSLVYWTSQAGLLVGLLCMAVNFLNAFGLVFLFGMGVTVLTTLSWAVLRSLFAGV